ncbi:MAG: hypothetical protein ACM65L_26435 [Microcoleus sp.]
MPYVTPREAANALGVNPRTIPNSQSVDPDRPSRDYFSMAIP